MLQDVLNLVQDALVLAAGTIIYLVPLPSEKVGKYDCLAKFVPACPYPRTTQGYIPAWLVL